MLIVGVLYALSVDVEGMQQYYRLLARQTMAEYVPSELSTVEIRVVLLAGFSVLGFGVGILARDAIDVCQRWFRAQQH